MSVIALMRYNIQQCARRHSPRGDGRREHPQISFTRAACRACVLRGYAIRSPNSSVPRGVMIGVIEVIPLTTQIEVSCIGGSARRRIRHGAHIRNRSDRGGGGGCEIMPTPRGLAREKLREIETTVIRGRR